MKGVVIEKNVDNSVILLSDGNIKMIKSISAIDIGSIVFLNDTTRSFDFSIKKLVSVTASILIIVGIGIGVYAWENPIQYINIDINPSVELSINCFQRIISINSFNEEGWQLVKSVSIKAQSYESGINKIISSAKDLGYIKGKGDVLISISSEDMRLNERTQATILEKIIESVEVMTFDTEEYNNSVESGLSPGKSNIIEKVIESGTCLSKNELADVSVNELIKKLNESIRKNESVEGQERVKKEEQKKEREELKEREEKENENHMKETEKQKTKDEKEEEQKKERKELKEKEEKENQMKETGKERAEEVREEEQKNKPKNEMIYLEKELLKRIEEKTKEWKRVIEDKIEKLSNKKERLKENTEKKKEEKTKGNTKNKGGKR